MKKSIFKGLLICFSLFGSFSLTSCSKDDLFRLVSKKLTYDQLKDKHEEGILFLAVTNKYSYKIVTKIISISDLLKGINYVSVECLTDEIYDLSSFNSDSYMCYFVTLEDKTDDYLLECANKLLLTNHFLYVSPSYYEVAATSSSDANYCNELSVHNYLDTNIQYAEKTTLK